MRSATSCCARSSAFAGSGAQSFSRTNFAACRAPRRPKTRMSTKEFVPRRLAPCTETPAHQLTQAQVHVVFPADAAAFLQFAIDGARDHVARSEVQEARRVTLHEALAVLIAKDSPLAARSFAQQDPELIDAGGMKLKKF